MKRIGYVVGVILLLCVGIWIGTNPLVHALIGWSERVSTQLAGEIAGVERCPPTTLRSHTIHRLNAGAPVRVNTQADGWSEQIKTAERDTVFRYDQSHGICVLTRKKNGQLIVTYRPAIFQRSDNWKPPIIPADTVAFATPDGPMSVEVRLP